jgi:hypothetical protein
MLFKSGEKVTVLIIVKQFFRGVVPTKVQNYNIDTGKTDR